MKKTIYLIFLILALSSCGPNIHSAYYTSGAGYNKQVIGARCSQCGRQMNISWHQYNTIQAISCPYCGATTNTKQASAAFKYEQDRANAQANTQALSNAIKEIGDSYSESQKAKANAYQSYSSPCQYRTYTIMVRGKTEFCTQQTNCDVYCY